MATKSIIKNIEISDPAEAEKLVKALEEAKKICDGAHFCVEGCEACEDNEYCDFRESEEDMERLTIRSDICCEPENNIVYSNPNDPEGMYNILDLAECLYNGGEAEAGILLDISNRLAAYEDTGLTPEQIQAQQQEIDRLKATLADWKYNTKCDADHIAALTADKDEQAGRLMKMDYLLRRTLPTLEVTNDQQGLIEQINELLGGKEDEKE